MADSQPTWVGSMLTLAGPHPQRGFIDRADPAQGLRGWALDMTDPAQPATLELCDGDKVLAATRADGARPDIAARLGAGVRAGFRFDPVTTPAQANAILRVRFAGTDKFLRQADPAAATAPLAPSATTQIVDDSPRPEVHARRARGPARKDPIQAATARPEPDTAPAIKTPDIKTPAIKTPDIEATGTEAAVVAQLGLRDALTVLRAEAEGQISARLWPKADTLRGYIEMLAEDSGGALWMSGWMHNDLALEFPAVISEMSQAACGVSLMRYYREDLPATAHGFIGLLETNWRPSETTHELYLFFGSGGEFHLASHTPLRIGTVDCLIDEYENIRDRLTGDGRAVELTNWLGALESWRPSRGAVQTQATRACVDQVILVPGVGALVDGWVLSPIHRVETLRLRVGGVVMSPRPGSLHRKPRLDLLEAFAGTEMMAPHAGFGGLFWAADPPKDLAGAMLAVVFEGGGAANFEVEASVFRKLGYSASLEEAEKCLPSLCHETFFPDFAKAVLATARVVPPTIEKVTVQRGWRVLILVLPEDLSDMSRLFETTSAACQTAGAGRSPIEAVCFVAASIANRAGTLALFKAFVTAMAQAVPALAASLFIIDGPTLAFAALPEILRDLRANRFVFVVDGLTLTDAGWDAVRACLEPGRTDLCLLGPEGWEAACFAWSAGPFCRWAGSAPAFLGGVFGDNGLTRVEWPHAAASHVRVAGASFYANPPVTTALRTAVNQAAMG